LNSKLVDTSERVSINRGKAKEEKKRRGRKKKDKAARKNQKKKRDQQIKETIE
jgi:hypothetical protein